MKNAQWYIMAVISHNMIDRDMTYNIKYHDEPQCPLMRMLETEDKAFIISLSPLILLKHTKCLRLTLLIICF